MIAEQLEALLPEWLARQRWYSGSEAPATVDIVDLDVLVESDDESGPGLLSLIVRADGIDWHVPVGWRAPHEVPPSVADREGAVISAPPLHHEFSTEEGPAMSRDLHPIPSE